MKLGKAKSPIKDYVSILDLNTLVLQAQSGTTADNNIFKVDGDSTYENVQFSEQHDPYMYDVESTMDQTRCMQDTDSASLANFFSRPVKISEVEWNTLADITYDFDPWSLYFENPRVSNRLTNFNLLKANLKLKVVINGNGFQYGRAMVVYLPYEVQDVLSPFTNRRQDLVSGSQMPHVLLNPTMSTGGELKLPFFYDKNYLSIPLSEWQNMGRVYVRTLNSLKHANGAADVVTVTVFAWAEDVSMSVLTSRDQNTLVPQSGEIDQVNAKGFISGPATSVAKFAAYMKGVPYIGPFATATEIGAGAVSSMAKIFGYCRPTITKAPDPYRPTQISSLALTNVADMSAKLTVDDKQELTIDPRISGLSGVDPFNIREIAKRESYLTSFNWPVGSAPDTLLWNGRVDPCTFSISGSENAYHFPACAMAALPFQYWKGSMKFRFQIVCSSFHKGRIRVAYDPNFFATSQYLTFDEYNVNYMKIVDIAEEQDFTIEVGNGQELSFLDHARPGRDVVSELHSTTRYGSFGAGNGVVAVSVVNELTTPNSTVNNDIEINVFVSMGEDFEVAAPDDYFSHFVLEPQSGTMVADGVKEQELDAPQQEEATLIGLPPAEDPQLNKVFMGEAITSFRPLLKRFALWNVLAKTDNVPTVVTQRYSAFPYLRGNVPNAVDLTPGGDPYNYVNTLLLHWVRMAFSGDRGSMRYKFVPRGTQSRGDRIEVQRAPLLDVQPLYDTTINTMIGYTSTTAARRDIMQDFVPGTFDNQPESSRPFPGMRGLALTTNQVNGAFEVEIPYYSNRRFSPGKSADYTGQSDNGSAFDVVAWFPGSQGDSNHTVYDVYAAAGEDFQCYFWTGLPRMYFESAPP